jgi:hypothetical protein
MDCHYPYSYVFIPHPGQSSPGKTWHASPKSMVPDILTTVKWWDLVGLPTLKPRISYWLWQIRMIFPWHGTPNKIHTINPSLGLRFLVLSSLYPHYTPILPPHPHDIPRVCLEIWYPNFFSGWIIVNSPGCHSWALWGPQRGCGYFPMYPLLQHGWKIARACRWASQLETSSVGIFQAMVEYQRVSPLYPYIPIISL